MKIFLIIEREFKTRVRKKNICYHVAAHLIFSLSIFTSLWISSIKDEVKQTIKLIDCTGLIGDKLQNTDLLSFESIDVASIDSVVVYTDDDFAVLYIEGRDANLPSDFILYSGNRVNADVRVYIEQSINKNRSLS